MNEPMNDVDERIRAALHAAVDDLHERDLRPALPPQAVPRRHRTIRWAAPLLAAAAVVAVVVTSVAVSSGPQAAKHSVPPAGSVSPTPTKPTPTVSAVNPPPSAVKSPEPTTTEPPTAVKTPPPEATLLGYEPLWPFADAAQVQQWRNQPGAQPWHLDAEQTALYFVRNYLRFTDITRVTSSQITIKGADIGVGYDNAPQRPHTAAVLHLLRFADDGTDTGAPWEVVGATASDFALVNTTRAESPSTLLTVDGTITGVDENITVGLHTLAGDTRTSTPTAAGGTNSRWAVSLRCDLRGVVTVVASTGGHVTAHDRFAVTGINVS